jgi:hypothetical protein
MADDEIRGSKIMTDKQMFQTWCEVLRPQFPEHAEFTFKPRRRTLCVTWQADVERKLWRSVSISFTNLAWKGYRGARAARRSRADQHLEALVRSLLPQFDSLHERSSDGRIEEVEISIASIDIFPPPAGITAGAGERLGAR